MHPDLTITQIDHVVQKGNLGLGGPRFQLFGFHAYCLVGNHGGDMHVELALWDFRQQLGWVGLLAKLCDHVLGLHVLTLGIELIQLWVGFPHASQRAKDSSLDHLLQFFSPNGWCPWWGSQVLLVRPSRILIFPVLGLRSLQVHDSGPPKRSDWTQVPPETSFSGPL